jgi:WD40 repeat protein
MNLHSSAALFVLASAFCCGPSRADAGPRLADLLGIWRADFNADASRIIVQMRDGRIGIWETENGRLVAGDLGAMERHGAYRMNQAATLAVVGFQSGRSRVFELKSAMAVSPELDVAFTETWKPSVFFSPDATRLVVFENSGRGRIIEIQSGQSLATIELPKPSDEREVSPSISFSKDGKSALIFDAEAVLRRYDTGSWVPIGDPMVHPHRAAYHGGFSATEDAGSAVTFDGPGENGPQGHLQIWDTVSARPIGETLSAQNGLSGTFFDEGKKLLIRPGRGETRVVHVPSLETSITLPRHDDVEASLAILSSDEKKIFTWGYDGRLLMTDTESGKQSFLYSGKALVSQVLTAPGPGTCWVVFDNTEFLLQNHHDHYVIRFDLANQKPAATLRIAGYPHRTILSPDGRRLMIHEGGSGKEKIRLFDAHSLSELPASAGGS